jgi:putative thioredoxin
VPDHVQAIAGLAGLLIDAGQIDEAAKLCSMPPRTRPTRMRRSPACSAGRARRAGRRARRCRGELERRLAADPKDHQARYDLAMIASARGERDQAADHLLAIMRQDRAWNEEAARKQLLQFFEAWGMTDEATLSARRKLSSLLFS